jgi:CRISPR-associated protein Csm4
MFAEGSVFAGVPEGTLADVTPTSFQAHSIYRNGIGLSLPIQVKTASKDNTKEAS